MKILGISNPGFTGVSVATKAIVTDYYPVPHLDQRVQVQNIVSMILRFDPDVLVIGGWSRGYSELVGILSKQRRFPVMTVYHSTPFHGSHFGDQLYIPEIEYAQDQGHIDVMGWVHPQTAMFYRTVKRRAATFVPHFFKPQPLVEKKPEFTIGVLGGNSWWKNSEGAVNVVRDFVRRNPGTKIVSTATYNKTHHEFMAIVNSCSVIVHLSHLECYSNIIQEAWARGVPAIVSPANKGLFKSPVVDPELQEQMMENFMLDDGIDPMQLYSKLNWIRGDIETQSKFIHEFYKVFQKSSVVYLSNVFKELGEAYKFKDYSEFLPVPARSQEPLQGHR